MRQSNPSWTGCAAGPCLPTGCNAATAPPLAPCRATVVPSPLSRAGENRSTPAGSRTRNPPPCPAALTGICPLQPDGD